MNPWQDTNLSPDQRASALLSELTLEEKIGQLGSHWHRAPASADVAEEADDAARDVAPMEHAFKAHQLEWQEACRNGLGHLTRTFGTNPVSVPEGLRLLRERQADVTRASRFGIPAIAHEECLTGFTALGATVYPAAIAWGATWRPELIAEMAEAIGDDLAAVGVHQGLSPLLDVVRDYRWGRVEETCGEDPYLVGTLGSAYVRGLQAAGVHATLKHFAGYAASRAGRNHAPISMGRRELEDVILPPFEMAVREGGAKSVMNSYCDIDGQPAAASRWLLTEVLRERWGFEGPVVSDYWAVDFLTQTHRVAPDAAHAAAISLRAGLDVELPATGSFSSIREAIERGLLDEATLDVAVARVLRQKAELGLLDADRDPLADAEVSRDLDSQRNRDIARRVAEESVVLLSNDGTLPLAEPGRVAVIGPVWTDVRSYMGCYAFPNHVLTRDGGHETGLEILSLRDALPAALGGEVVFTEGCGFTDGTDEQLSEAVRVASEADLVILTVGDIAGMFGVGTSGEGCDVADLRLPGRQGELVEAVLATGTKVVLVLVTGRPYALGEYVERCAAIVQAFMPGVEGTGVLVRILTGELNPSGRLPIGIPGGHGNQPGTYLAPSLGWFSDGISNLDPRPVFPFGAGESYTSFAYGSPEVSSSQIPVDGTVEYSVTVTNTGERTGAETVQLYLEDPWAEVVRPLKQLIGYVKVDLEPGEARRVTFRVHADRTSFTGVDLQRIVEPGEILLSAGHSSEDRLAGLAVELVGERRVVGEGRVLRTPVELS
ncbi:glycoside hydrolase family 3 C-terminal domain-containing protein [Tessaracoccus sp. OS52]|uniref:glycoside hydrolase family 3 N-terminal domain-containing protein n=1 Tax=Tessaracoccus sp. OS52 TaxID=2886691 RepID=UPI001D0FAB23|nr:glycoside hydrolase family 3 N-terminal domain-containing protein [Tessaracoccus sp. OS52]MCC2592153.1 glycoside hydrolase family 3 C-terminal domain-containing protein [Tessaracoccus sp. OS52]